MNVKFYLIKSRRNSIMRSIYAYITINRKSIVIPTGVEINPKYWDKRSQQVKIGAPNFLQINKLLDKIKDKLLATIYEIKTDNINASQAEIFDKIKDKFKQFNNYRVVDIIATYLDKNAPTLADGYKKTFRTLANHISEFNQNLNLHNITPQFVDDFTNFLLNKQVTNEHISKQFKTLRTVLNWAFARGYPPINLEFLKPKVVGKNDTTFALTIDELVVLSKFQTTKPYWQFVLDAFLFACFTGMRFSDIKEFSKASIKDNFIEIVQNKTRQKSYIFLLPQAREILNKYKLQHPFQNLHSQVANRYLKQIARQAGLNRIVQLTKFSGNKRITTEYPVYKVVAFHTARRTFATILTSMNINPDLIKAMTGHRTHSQFERYIKFDPATLKQLADKFELLN